MRGIIHVPSTLGGVRPNAHDPAEMEKRKVVYLRMETEKKKAAYDKSKQELIIAEKNLKDMRRHCQNCGQCSACV